MRKAVQGTFTSALFLSAAVLVATIVGAVFAVIIIVLGKVKTIHFQLLVIWYTTG